MLRKVINLDKDSEPDIYNAIKRDALLENVTLDENGKIDFADKSVTENTRVSYPINHIQNIVRPISSAPAAKNVIFLSADAFGVLPPVSVLTPEQTQYYFLSGFTAKLAGTERGITEPTPTFSACFGQAFLELHPTKYAEELVKKMEKSGAKAYLVNTGWNGTGKRISIKDTRGIIDAILNGDIKTAPTKTIPYFNFEVPTELPGVDPAILDPRDTYADASEWEVKAKDLAARFVKNFAKYEGNEAGKALVAAGLRLNDLLISINLFFSLKETGCHIASGFFITHIWSSIMLKKFIKYVSQNMLGMVGMSVYILADTYFISVAVGADGITALNLVLPIYNIIFAIGAMMGVGSAIRFVVERNKKARMQIDIFSMRLCGLLSSVCFLFLSVCFFRIN